MSDVVGATFGLYNISDPIYTGGTGSTALNVNQSAVMVNPKR